MSLLCRLKKLVHKGLLKKEDLDRIVIIPKEQENKVIQMREATPEERESINKYVNSISKLTGVSFENLEQESCEDCISRTEVNKLIQASHLNLGNLLDTEIMQARINSLLPCIHSTQKMGHWITTRTLMHDGEYYCDKCDHSSPENKKWDYCPNCGAKGK